MVICRGVQSKYICEVRQSCLAVPSTHQEPSADGIPNHAGDFTADLEYGRRGGFGL
jgi:hypothetical protein